MRKTVNVTLMSVDGLIERMEDWHYEYIDEEMNALFADQLRKSDALLLGRRTYEGFADSWPSATGEIADKVNAMRSTSPPPRSRRPTGTTRA